jgi:AraC-like DNA-binding protein
MHAHKEILLNLARNMYAYGYSEPEIWKEAGFNINQVSDSNEMIDARYGIVLWETIIKCSGYSLVGLSFGKNISFSALSWISGLAQSANTLKDFWKSFCDFSLLMGDMFFYTLKEEKNTFVINYYPNEAWLLKSPDTAAQACDHAMSLTITLSEFLCGNKISVEEANFKHQIKKEYLLEYEKVFNTVKHSKENSCLIFTKEIGDYPVIGSNELVYKHMLDFCEQKLLELTHLEKFSDKVRSILAKKNSFYLPKLNEVAAMLHVSPRTLQRKLKEENILYHSLVEEFQIGQAKHLLMQKQIQLKEIAYLLGYSNTESFHRSFKRNTGLSPGAFKQKGL